MSEEERAQQPIVVDLTKQELTSIVLTRTLGTHHDADLLISRLRFHLSKRYRYLPGTDREDIISETILTLIETLRKGTKIHNPAAYANRVADHKASEVWARENKHPTVAFDALAEKDNIDEGIDIIGGLVKKETLGAIYRALSKLSVQDHCLLIWHHFEQMTIPEIIESHFSPDKDVSVSAVKMRLKRAREKVRELVEKEEMEACRSISGAPSEEPGR